MRNRKPKSASGNYEVGYGRPPAKSRWKPGQSGNPRGRRRGAKSLGTMMRDVCSQKVTVRNQDGLRTMTLLEASILQQGAKALQGDPKALKFLLENALPLPEPIDSRISSKGDPQRGFEIWQQIVGVTQRPPRR